MIQLGDGILASAVDSDEEVERALFRADLGGVNLEIANRIWLEALAGGLVAVGCGQAADVMALQAQVQG
jgi:hypothetical protein